jgi:ABC-2 type transport system ATP-binding protein
VYGLLGPNGAGKTTTIQLLLGLYKPTNGSAAVFGLDPWKNADEVRAKSGALLEHHGLYERASAMYNLELFGRINRVPIGEINHRIKDALEPLGLWERRNEQVGKWSKGMKQKLAIARCLLHHPPLVFLDEPTAGHDPVSAKELRDHLRDVVRDRGTTIFLTTHNLAEAEALCGRVGILQKGHLIAEGAPADLRARARTPRIVVHADGVTKPMLAKLGRLDRVASVHQENGVLSIALRADTPAAPIVTLLVDSGARVEEVRKEKATMEETYIDLTKEA